MGNLEKSRECFSHRMVVLAAPARNTHRTVVLAAPDAGPERPVWCQSVAQVCRAHQTLAPDAGRLLSVRPVWSDVSKCARGVSDWRAPDVEGASGDPASLRSSLRTGPVCTGRVRCGLAERPVVLCQARVRSSRWRQWSNSNG